MNWGKTTHPSLAGLAIVQRLDRRLRSVRLAVEGDTLILAAPRRLDRATERRIAQDHVGWIEAQRRRRLWEHGKALPFRGEDLTLGFCSHPEVKRVDAMLWAPEGDEADIGAAVLRWYATQAQALILPRVAVFCERAGLAKPAVRLANAGRRWGSCSPRTGIRLNWRLVMLPVELADHVVAHEVSHLKHLDHGPLFHRFWEELLPGSHAGRNLLRAWEARCFAVGA